MAIYVTKPIDNETLASGVSVSSTASRAGVKRVVVPSTANLTTTSSNFALTIPADSTADHIELVVDGTVATSGVGGGAIRNLDDRTVVLRGNGTITGGTVAQTGLAETGNGTEENIDGTAVDVVVNANADTTHSSSLEFFNDGATDTRPLDGVNGAVTGTRTQVTQTATGTRRGDGDVIGNFTANPNTGGAGEIATITRTGSTLTGQTASGTGDQTVTAGTVSRTSRNRTGLTDSGTGQATGTSTRGAVTRTLSDRTGLSDSGRGEATGTSSRGAVTVAAVDATDVSTVLTFIQASPLFGIDHTLVTELTYQNRPGETQENATLTWGVTNSSFNFSEDVTFPSTPASVIDFGTDPVDRYEATFASPHTFTIGGVTATATGVAVDVTTEPGDARGVFLIGTFPAALTMHWSLELGDIIGVATRLSAGTTDRTLLSYLFQSVSDGTAIAGQTLNVSFRTGDGFSVTLDHADGFTGGDYRLINGTNINDQSTGTLTGSTAVITGFTRPDIFLSLSDITEEDAISRYTWAPAAGFSGGIINVVGGNVTNRNSNANWTVRNITQTDGLASYQWQAASGFSGGSLSVTGGNSNNTNLNALWSVSGITQINGLHDYTWSPNTAGGYTGGILDVTGGNGLETGNTDSNAAWSVSGLTVGSFNYTVAAASGYTLTSSATPLSNSLDDNPSLTVTVSRPVYNYAITSYATGFSGGTISVSGGTTNNPNDNAAWSVSNATRQRVTYTLGGVTAGDSATLSVPGGEPASRSSNGLIELFASTPVTWTLSGTALSTLTAETLSGNFDTSNFNGTFN